MLTGTNLQYTKAHNVRTVLETIRLYGPLSRGDIARRTELTLQTVSNITKLLGDEGMVIDAERLQEGRGAPTTLLALNPDGAFSIGFDLDRDHLTCLLVDLAGTVRQRIALDVDFPSPSEAVELMESTSHELIGREGVPLENLWGVGVGVPGPLGVSEGSTVTNRSNPGAFPGWTNVPVVDLLRERLDLPVFLENNGTAAAIGERWYGDGRHLRTFFYVYFGAGLGGGLIVDRHPYEGSTGNAGELGYLPLPTMPEDADNFGRPHLGIHFNLPRLYRHLRENGTPITRSTELDHLFEDQNEVLLRWIDEGATQLAPALIAVEYLIDPDAIFLGGRLPASMLQALITNLEEILPSLRVQGRAAETRLRQASVGEDAAALGVATLPLYMSLAPAPRLIMKRADNSATALLKPS